MPNRNYHKILLFCNTVAVGDECCAVVCSVVLYCAVAAAADQSQAITDQ